MLVGQFIDLPSGQRVDVESDYLTRQLPYGRAGFGGVYPNGDPWLFVVQAAPAAAELDPPGDAVALMRRSTNSVLGYNAEGELKLEAEWTRDGLVELYGNCEVVGTERPARGRGCSAGTAEVSLVPRELVHDWRHPSLLAIWSPCLAAPRFSGAVVVSSGFPHGCPVLLSRQV